jgi:membrane protein DedA with SNARE-associated domain
MLSDLVEGIAALVEQIVTTFGAPGITLIALFENLFPPTPSEALYPLAGKLAYDGAISPVAVVIAGTIGSIIGALAYYTLGYKMGEVRTRDLIARYGSIRLLRFTINIVSTEDYDRGMALFHRYGGRIVFAARLLPLVHGVVSIPAGVVRMSLPRFILYTALGSALWIAPLTLLGFWLGENWRQILTALDVYQNVVYVLLALLLVYYIVRRLRRTKEKSGVVPE